MFRSLRQGVCLRPPAGPGQSPGRGSGGGAKKNWQNKVQAKAFLPNGSYAPEGTFNCMKKVKLSELCNADLVKRMGFSHAIQGMQYRVEETDYLQNLYITYKNRVIAISSSVIVRRNTKSEVRITNCTAKVKTRKFETTKKDLTRYKPFRGKR